MLRRDSLSTDRTVLLLCALAGTALAALGAAILAAPGVSDRLLLALTALRGETSAADWYRNLRATGAEAIFDGALLVALGALAFPRRRQLAVALADLRLLGALGAAALVALWLPVVLFARTTVIDGVRYWWLGDDAMISMRYARNLARGLGLVWNPGERVEGYTNYLWTLFMALVHLLPIPDSSTSLVVLLANVVIAAAAIPAILGLVRALGGGSWVAVGTIASYVLSMNALYWTTYGFETALLTLDFTLGAYLVLRDAQDGRTRLRTYLLIAAMSLIRADAIVLSGLLYAVSFLLVSGDKERRRAVGLIAISLVIPVAQEAFRIYYYGDLLPNTAYLKTTNWDGRLASGVSYVLLFVERYFIPLALAVVGALFTRSAARRLLIGAILLYAGYIAYVGGDAFPDFRFFVPVLPLLLALAFLAVQDLAVLARREMLKIAVGAVCLASIPLITPGYSVALFPYSADVGNVEIGVYLRDHTPATSRVADFWAGSVLYFSDRYGIDLLGKSDKYLARMPVEHGGTLPGHNKFDFAYSLGALHPDYVVSHFRLPVTDEEMRQASVGPFAYTGLLYFDPTFREHCLGTPVQTDTWRTIFACHWTGS